MLLNPGLQTQCLEGSGGEGEAEVSCYKTIGVMGSLLLRLTRPERLCQQSPYTVSKCVKAMNQLMNG